MSVARRLAGALRAAVLLAAALVAVPGAAPAAAADAPEYPGAPLFEAPALDAARRAALRQAFAGDPAEAEVALAALLARAPRSPVLHAAMAAVRLAGGGAATAIDSLAEAARLGFAETAALAAAAPFAALRADPALAARLDAALAAAAPPPPLPEPPPAAIGPEMTAPVTPGASRWRADLAAIETLFRFPSGLERVPVRGPDAGSEARTLRRLQARGEAAGNAGDLYDNRDDGHSRLKQADYPQIGFVAYGPEARAAGLHYGVNLDLRFSGVVFGNSSTAVTAGPLRRSLPRLALTRPDGAAALAGQYAANHLYVYPAHHDFGRDEGDLSGDLIPANTPYLIASLGSSGSDQPFLRAVADILAAFRPDTKRFLRERGLIAPTVQMVLRRGLAPEGADYADPAFHPPVFDGAALSGRRAQGRDGARTRARLVALANGIAPDEVPPPARLAVIEEGVTQAEIVGSGGAFGETLFDTPSAAARLARGPAFARRYVLSAAATEDPNGRSLAFSWRAAGVGAEGVRLTPLDARGATVELVVPWPAGDGAGERGGRLDIVLVTHNGVHPSAPAFFSLAFPPWERRVYDAAGRAVSIDYGAREGRYADPILFPARDWRDDFDYAADGRLLGWTRTREGRTERFTRHGLLVLESDALGRPRRAERLAYAAGGDRAVVARPTGATFAYAYADDSDRFGVARGEGAAAGETLD